MESVQALKPLMLQFKTCLGQAVQGKWRDVQLASDGLCVLLLCCFFALT